MAITITQLRSFLAVVRTGSVTAAADELIVTQPSISAAVAALSRELGAPLTERVGRRVHPSPAGEAFVPYAADVIGLLDQGRRAAREAAERADLELRIAAVNTAGEYIVPPLMEAFAAEHPEIRLNVDVGNRERVFDRVRTHQADVAIGGRPPSGGGVAGSRFLDNPSVVITRSGDPLAARSSVPVAELAQRAWLVREEGSGTRMMTEEFLAGQGLEPEILTLGSNGAIKEGVRAGLGIALQSRLATARELEFGLLEEIHVRGSVLPHRHWYVLRPEHGPTRPPVAKFIEFVQSEPARRAIERAQHLPGYPSPPRSGLEVS
jgi:LysR family transcriptional regulator, low CO2-responsive transcriptional regulator